jgi:ribonuclease P protein subunit POP4
LTPITARNLTRHELIGLKVRVTDSTCKSQTHIGGEVVDETRNMLQINNGEKKRWLPKDTSTFQFKLHDKSIIEVKGSRLVGRPEDRVKKAGRSW